MDAKQNKAEYFYDSYNRVTLIKIKRHEWVVPAWPPGAPGSLIERPEQKMVFVYDSNSEPGFNLRWVWAHAEGRDGLRRIDGRFDGGDGV